MASGGSAIRGSRVGAGPMGEQYRGFKSERVQRSYYCINGHVQEPMFAAHIDPAEIPDMIDCPNCGMPAGQDKKNPPEIAKHEPYKTHLAYVKERRTSEEAKALLDEALASIRERRAKLAQEATKQAKLAVARAAAAKVAAAKAAAAKAVKPIKPVKPAAKPAKPAAKASAKAAPKKASAKPVAKKAVKPASKAKPVAKAAPKSKLKTSATKTKSKVAAKPTAKKGTKK
jgi:Tfp pilus assembly protein FimV